MDDVTAQAAPAASTEPAPPGEPAVSASSTENDALAKPQTDPEAAPKGKPKTGRKRKAKPKPEPDSPEDEKEPISPYAALPTGLMWAPMLGRFSGFWISVGCIAGTIVPLVGLALYYSRSRTLPAIAGIDFAAALLAAGVGVILIGVVLALGEVLVIRPIAPKTEVLMPIEAATLDIAELTPKSNVVAGFAEAAKALATVARGLSPGRLLIVMGMLVILMSAWVAQSTAAPPATPSPDASASPTVTTSGSPPASPSVTAINSTGSPSPSAG